MPTLSVDRYQEQLEERVHRLIGFLEDQREKSVFSRDWIIAFQEKTDAILGELKTTQLKILITGTQGTGKSTLLQSLLPENFSPKETDNPSNGYKVISSGDILFYDTSGLDSLKENHVEQVLQLAEECHLVLFVISASAGSLDRIQMDFLQKISEKIGEIWIMVNKMDLRDA